MLLPSSGSAQESWVKQFKAFCQFENRYVRDIRIRLLAEDFLEKQNVLEYSSCSCFLVTPTHKDLLIRKKKALHRFTDERLCSTEGNAASGKLTKQRLCQSHLGKRVLGYGVISSPHELIAYQRITSCLEIQHRVIARTETAF
jgi:hypothetical protein